MKKFLNNPWPYAIMAWFALAITGMVTWITIAVRNDHELVRKDYYEAEIGFQNQIDRVNRTGAVRKEVSVRYQAGDEVVLLSLPPAHTGARGKVQFYRPSNSKLDRAFDIDLASNSTQRLEVGALQGGLWKIQVTWSHEGVEYFFDQPLVLAGKS